MRRLLLVVLSMACLAPSMVAAAEANRCDAFLARVQAGERNFRRLDLHGCDFHGQDLHGVLLMQVDLRGADLSGANLDGAGFFRTDVTGADLRGASLRHTSLYVSSLEDLRLEGAWVEAVRPERMGDEARALAARRPPAGVEDPPSAPLASLTSTIDQVWSVE